MIKRRIRPLIRGFIPLALVASLAVISLTSSINPVSAAPAAQIGNAQIITVTNNLGGAGYDQIGRYTQNFQVSPGVYGNSRVICTGLSVSACRLSAVTFGFGNAGDIPLAGTWKPGLAAGFGVARPSNGWPISSFRRLP